MGPDVAWNDLARHMFPEPGRTGDVVSRGTGSQATMGFAIRRGVKRVRTQGSATMVLAEPKHSSAQTGSLMGLHFIISASHVLTDPAKSREVNQWLKGYGVKNYTFSAGVASEPMPVRGAAWEPMRLVPYAAPPVKLVEEVSSAARELVEQLDPAKTRAEATRPIETVDVVSRVPTKSPEEFLISSRVTDFVLRGIHATSEIASRQLATDDRWAALADLLPPQDLSALHVRQATTRRVRRMFRSLASQTREDGSKMRLLAGASSWSIDIQYEILDRLPVRPDETSEFLRALLLDISTALKSGVPVAGGWGHLQISADGELTLAVAPSREPEDFVQTRSAARFTRIR